MSISPEAHARYHVKVVRPEGRFPQTADVDAFHTGDDANALAERLRGISPEHEYVVELIQDGSVLTRDGIALDSGEDA